MVENFFPFLRSLGGSWLVWAGGILRMIPFIEDLLEPWLRKTYPKVDTWFIERGTALKKNLKLIAVVCLLIGCYRAWIFEHNNAEAAMYGKDGKSEAWGKYNECYADNREYMAERRTFDSQLNDKQKRIDSQQDTIDSQLSTVTSCITTLTKTNTPEPLKIINRAIIVGDEKPTTVILVAETNKRIPAYSGKIQCASPFTLIQARMMLGVVSFSPQYHQNSGQTELAIKFNGATWDTHEPIVAIVQGAELAPESCSVTSQ